MLNMDGGMFAILFSVFCSNINFFKKKTKHKSAPSQYLRLQSAISTDCPVKTSLNSIQMCIRMQQNLTYSSLSRKEHRHKWSREQAQKV